MRHAGVWYAASCRGGGGIRGASGSLRSPFPTYREGMRVDGPLIAFPGPARLHLGPPPTCVGGAGDQAGPASHATAVAGAARGAGSEAAAAGCGVAPQPATCLSSTCDLLSRSGRSERTDGSSSGVCRRRPASVRGSALRVRRAVGLAPPRRAAAQGSLRAPASSLRLAPPGSGFPTPPGPRRCRAIITWPKPDQAWRLQSTVSAGEAAPRTRASHPVPWGRRGVCPVPASRLPSPLPPGPRPPRSRRRGRFSHRAFRLLSASSVRLQSLLPRALSLSR